MSITNQMILRSISKLKRTSFSPALSSLLKITFNSSPSLQNQPSYHSSASLIPQHNNPKIHNTLHSSSKPVNFTHLSPFRYASLLQSCIAKKAIKPGKQLHARIYLSGYALDTFLVTKLVNLYCVCGHVDYAHHLFDKIPKDNIFLWNVLIRAYAWFGPNENAISLYYQMIDHGIVPDNFTFPFVLKACSSLSAIREGKDIHENVIRKGWETDIFVGASLIDMYAKCSHVSNAREVFDKIKVRDVVLWNSMLAAYSQNSHPEECLSLCREMAMEGLSFTEATIVIAISASADTAALPQGKEIHGFSLRNGFEFNDKVKTALVDMYAKSGYVKVARNLFKQLSVKRVISWNAIINGYAMHGHAFEALDLFKEMKRMAQPDHITFVGVLQACNRGGLVNEGWKYFESMVHDHRINPTIQHHTCMVGLLGNCGRLNEAYNHIQQMKLKPDSGIWGALLNSCKIHGNVDLGRLAFDKLIELEPDDGGNYVILSNMYAQAGNWGEIVNLRKLMTERGLKKTVACSWIEIKNKKHAFLSGDTSHPYSNDIYKELERLEMLMKRVGYVPDIKPVFHDVEDDEKSSMVCSHSERLAIAFGLVSTSHGTRLLVTKNLRVCEDCHVAIKIISKITEREIILRDVNRYHHFKDGICSCGDYW